MKKHPTDDLFARKLNQAEIKPRPQAWEALQNRLQIKKVRLAWWQHRESWLAAAGLSLLLVAGWSAWQNRSTSEVKIAQNEPLRDFPKQAIGQPNRAQAPAIIKENVAINQGLKTSPVVKPHGTHNNNNNNNNITRTATQKTAPSMVSTNLAQTSTNAPEIPQIAIEPTPTIAHQIQPDLAQPTAQKTIVLQLPEVPIAQTADMPFPETAPIQGNRKSSRFARIFRQVQNAKEGQRVDWDEVGVNPNKLLAKVTRRNEIE